MKPKLSPSITYSDSVIREETTKKLSIIGTFQFFNAPAFPFACPVFVVTVGLESLPVGELVSVLVEIVSAEELVLAHATGQLKLTPPHESEFEIQLSFGLGGLVFLSPGRYHVRVSVDGEEIGGRPLFVRQLSSPS